MNPLRVLLFTVTISTAALASQDASYDLIWKPKADDVLDYGLSLHIDVDQKAFLYMTDVHMKVLKVKENGDYELETSTRNTTIRYGDDDPMTADKEPEPTIETYNVKGQRIDQNKDKTEDDEDADPVGKILGEVTDFTAPEKPVKVGDKWSKVVAADKKGKIDAANLDYSVSATEGTGDDQVVRVDFTYRQTEGATPVKAVGVYRLRMKDYSMQSFEANVENFRMDDQAPAGTAKLEMKRK